MLWNLLRSYATQGSLHFSGRRSVDEWALREHLYFYNRDSLKFALEEAGFKVEAFLPLPGNRQGKLLKDLIFGGYYMASRLGWFLSAHRLMLGPSLLVVASLQGTS